jgi:hypothetical protein
MTGEAFESAGMCVGVTFLVAKELRRRFSVEDDEEARLSTVRSTIKTIGMQTSHLEKGSL